MDAVVGFGLAAAVVGAVALYFAPSIVAFRRGTEASGWIFILNLLFGLTLIGWVLPLLWAYVGRTHRDRRDTQRMIELQEEQVRLLRADRLKF
jgi:hypothetical protein